MATVKPTPFSSILIANRGEIACRIMRTAKAMGLKTIAVYSEADANAPHVKMADQAVCIGPAPVGESYLVMDKTLEAAETTAAEAIHPGYGFLSENAAFAKACKKAGLVFIGPEPDAIDLMGDKAKSKRRMIKAGVPCVPGYQGEKQDDKTLITASKDIGFPIMVKAAAGGGGRGMRFVSDAKALPDAIKDARSEAANAFGSDILILERAVQQPRHVEIQVFADKFGNTIHLGERDCSVQRRHQKVLEEAPCPVMTPELRAAMGASAVKAAKDIGYVGAGTVEFMLDCSGEFFFLEMNTRLQVEHPVTEMVTGLDLVALQIRVARGEDLGLTQDDITLTGHAIEARLYAEDPAADFLPATGSIHRWAPASGDGIRIDSGIETGGEVSPYYDPMIAKIIAYGANREEARLKLIGAIKDTAIMGLKTNKRFLIDVLSKGAFIKGEATTAFIAENFKDADLKNENLPIEDAAVAAVIQYGLSRDAALTSAVHIAPALRNWSSATKIGTPYIYGLKEEALRLVVTPQSPGHYHVTHIERKIAVDVLSRADNHAVLSLDGSWVKVQFYSDHEAKIEISIEGRSHTLANQTMIMASAAEAVGGGSVIAPMHGSLLEIFVQAGNTVTKGQRLAILEAMKMQHEILAEIDGTVSKIHVETGTQIAAETLMIEIEKDEQNAEAIDFKHECDSIAAILKGKTENELQTSTLFKGWTINDIVGHLHLWNIAADQTLNQPEAFQAFVKAAMGALTTGKSHVQYQDEYFGDMSAVDRLEAWKEYYPAMAERYAAADPDARVKWAGPDMSVKSCIIARQMEHWAHAQAIFDVLGLDRTNEDRIRNVAHIGVTTYSWSFKVKGLDPIKPKPYVKLTAPSGATWEWNDPQDNNRVEGSATEFSQVVTQCRNIGDTNLKTIGEAATTWMNIAQCFAGGPEIAPAKGVRHKSQNS